MVAICKDIDFIFNVNVFLKHLLLLIKFLLNTSKKVLVCSHLQKVAHRAKKEGPKALNPSP